jgi:hypothetical protein
MPAPREDGITVSNGSDTRGIFPLAFVRPKSGDQNKLVVISSYRRIEEIDLRGSTELSDSSKVIRPVAAEEFEKRFKIKESWSLDFFFNRKKEPESK